MYLRIKGLYTAQVGISFAAMFFKGQAKQWWLYYDEKIDEGKEDVILNFSDFKSVLRLVFRPENKEREARTAIHRIRQDGSVKDYSKRFLEISRDLPNMDIDDQVHAYIHGLSGEYAAQVLVQKPTTVTTAMSMAEDLESLYKSVPTGQRSQGGSAGKWSSGGGASSNLARSSNGKWRSSTTNASTAAASGSGGGAAAGDNDKKKCFYCNNPGHWKRDCRKLQADIKSGKVDASGNARASQ